MNVRLSFCFLYQILVGASFAYFFLLLFVQLCLFLEFTDCPGPQSESAGKSDACEGCPNQQICATAPKGPDPGIIGFFYFIFMLYIDVSDNL